MELNRGNAVMADENEFLTAEEVAAFLRIPLSTIYKLTQDQKIPAFKIGKHWRYKKQSILRWVDQQEKNSTQSLP